MREIGASFLFTGEVLGQRPMSQHRRAIDLIDRDSGLGDVTLRPLSAHLLDPTQPERQGLVDRARLLAIQGRSRGAQLAYAAEHGVAGFGCPAGGCLLTDPLIARRLRELGARPYGVVRIDSACGVADWAKDPEGNQQRIAQTFNEACDVAEEFGERLAAEGEIC